MARSRSIRHRFARPLARLIHAGVRRSGGTVVLDAFNESLQHPPKTGIPIHRCAKRTLHLQHAKAMHDAADAAKRTYYGPQDQESVGNDSLSMVVQFGGPCGNGYMSRRQLSDSFAKLENEGRFEGGVNRRNTPAPDGRINQDSYEAIWEYQNSRPITYSKPRFMDLVHFREQNFEWQAVADKTGTAIKHIASLTEKGVAIFFVRLDAGAQYTLKAAQQTQLVFIKHGTGKFASGDSWLQHTAVQVSVAESLDMQASTPTEAVVLLLPRI